MSSTSAPAELSEAQQKAIERVARATFQALDCRDFARVDLRMAPDGQVYVFEVNPLPGMTPGYSDLVLISKAAGMDYDQLMAEITVGGLKRLREKERRERAEEEAESGESNSSLELGTAEKTQKAAKQMGKLARKRKKSRREAAARKASGSSHTVATPLPAGASTTTH